MPVELAARVHVRVEHAHAPHQRERAQDVEPETDKVQLLDQRPPREQKERAARRESTRHHWSTVRRSAARWVRARCDNRSRTGTATCDVHFRPSPLDAEGQWMGIHTAMQREVGGAEQHRDAGLQLLLGCGRDTQLVQCDGKDDDRETKGENNEPRRCLGRVC